MPEMREVYSSVVDSIGYSNGDLHVQWARTGKVSVYKGVPPQVAEEVMNAPSIGSALREVIQGKFEHGYA